ncbi:MAG: peptidylprolyl isomerase [candidate division Zixibacteria bacterium]|nr:peptidylprolyl isomerase [candidate division Zixibacteria bacterium]
MFEALRKLIFPIIIIVLLFFVAMIVLEWGLDITGRQQFAGANFAGSVNGEKIPWDTYNRIFNNLYQTESQQSEAELPDSRVRELEQSAWNQLVHDQLLAQEAAKRNIVVTDEELYAYLRLQPPQFLQSAPNFQTNGQFDYQKYVQAMVDPQWSSFWASIEPTMRAEIQKLKMQEIIVQTVAVSEVEVKQAFLEGIEKVKLGLVNVPLNRFNASIPQATDDQVRQYFDQHKDKYKQEERAVLNMVLLDKQPGEEDWVRVRQRLQVIYDSIRAGADFAEMARLYSQDGSAAGGGDLGWFGQGQMVPEFDQRAFSLTSGQVSEPFRTQFGWHIMLHQGYRDTVLTPGTPAVRQAHASHILLRVDQSQETLDAAFQRLSDFQLIADEKSFKDAVAETGLELKTTTPFTRRGPIQFIGYDAIADSFAFQNEVGAVSQVMENNSGFFVLEVAEKIPAGEASFEEVKPRVAQDARRELVVKACHDLAERVMSMVKAGQPLPAAAQANGLTYSETDYLTRTGYHAELGRDPIALGAAFGMTSVGQIIGPVDHGLGSAVMTMLEKQTPDLTQFNEKRDSVYQSVVQAKQQEMYSRWFDHLVQNSKIENNVARVNRSEYM